MAELIHFWRVERNDFLEASRTGEGARIVGGRWNSPGLPAIYCSGSLSLALLEILVHAATVEERANPRSWFKLAAPQDAVETVSSSRLPKGWNDPTAKPMTAEIGDAWLRKRRTPILRVPSAIVHGEWNFVLNPAHPNFRRQIRWSAPVELVLDRRLADHSPAVSGGGSPKSR